MHKALLSLFFAAGTLLAQSSPAVNVPMAGVYGEIALGSLASVNFNITTDQAITISSSNYVITKIVVYGASTSLTLAAGGLYTATSKGGTVLVAAAQVYSGLTSATKYLNPALAAVVLTDVRTETTLYFSLTVAQGAAATGKIAIYGISLP